MAKPVFYDPNQARWKRVRRLFDVLGVSVSLLIVFFAFTALRSESLPKLVLPVEKHPYHPLTEREKEVLSLVAKGASNKQIARSIQVSVRTVEAHLRSIYSKLQVQSRTEAAIRALKEGWLVLEDLESREDGTD